MLPTQHRLPTFVLALLLAATSVGCVQRRMMIRTHPEGALVYLNGQEIGRTPISTDFTYYGDFEVKLIKDGYETETIIQPVPTPWYEIPPLDFVSENIVPQKIHDQRVLSYNLRPKMMPSVEQIRSEAEQLRTASRTQALQALPQGEPVPVPPRTNLLPQPLAPELLPPPGAQPFQPMQPAPAQPIGPGFNPGAPNWPTQ